MARRSSAFVVRVLENRSLLARRAYKTLQSNFLGD
jgi:hypothetical protein